MIGPPPGSGPPVGAGPDTWTEAPPPSDRDDRPGTPATEPGPSWGERATRPDPAPTSVPSWGERATGPDRSPATEPDPSWPARATEPGPAPGWEPVAGPAPQAARGPGPRPTPAAPPEPSAEPARRRRWRRHRLTARALRVLALTLPVVAGAAAAAAMVRWGRRPERPGMAAAWVLSVVSLTVAVMVVVGRLSRRLLPLSALLGISLTFPGRPPRRVRLGLGVGRAGNLDERLAAFRRNGLSADPLRAATQAVALLGATTIREWGTWAHAERVARLSDRVAVDLGVGPADRERLRWAALLHDLGSLALDASLTTQARPLQGADIRTVHAHPVAGSRVVAPLRAWLGEWAAAVAEHHERWDGGGYPLGLVGDEIHRSAGIVAVADAFDAMTSSWSYRAAVPTSRARAEIRRESGQQFDPAAAEAFLRRRNGGRALVRLPYLWRAETPIWRRVRGPVVLVASSTAFVAAGLASGLPIERDRPPALVAGRTVERAPADTGAPSGTTAPATSATTRPPAPTSTTSTSIVPAIAGIPREITLPYAGAVMRALDGALGDALRALVAAGGPTDDFDARLAAIYAEPELSRKRGVYATEGARSLGVLRKDPPDPVTTVDQVVRGDLGCVVLAVRRDFSQLLTTPAAPPPPGFVVLRPRPPGGDRGPSNPTAWWMAFDGTTADGRPPSAIC